MMFYRKYLAVVVLLFANFHILDSMLIKYFFPCLADSSVLFKNECVSCLRPHLVDHLRSYSNDSLLSWESQDHVRWCLKGPLDTFAWEMAKGKKFLSGRTLHIITIDRPPFVKVLQDNKYSGVVIDILRVLQFKYNFTPNFFLPPDGNWGVKVNGSWNGMVGEVVKRNADVAAASLSVTLDRAKVIDFTFSFHQEPTSILIPAPKPGNKLTTLIRPFQHQVWLAVVATVFVLCPSLFVMHLLTLRIRGQTDAYKSINGVKLIGDLFQFFVGSLVQESIISPVNKTSKFLIVIWWFIALILANVYTGYMVSFLSAPKLYDIVNSLDELVQKRVLRWTFRINAALEDLFKSETSTLYSAVWKGARESDLVREDKEGVEKVLSGPFAFLKEKSYLEFALSKDFETNEGICRMTTAAKTFFNVGFSFGVQKHSQFLFLLNFEILNVLATGLVDKWKLENWPKHLQCVKAASYILSTQPKTRKLTVEDCQGAYFILLCGLITATVAYIFEIKHKLLYYGSRYIGRKQNNLTTSWKQ